MKCDQVSENRIDATFFLSGSNLQIFENQETRSFNKTFIAEYNPEFGSVTNSYLLIHIKGIDSIFVKPISFLDSINIQFSEWFNDIEKVKSFWGCPGDYKKDTLPIFIGEIKSNGDSVIFYKVRRMFVPYI